MASNELNCAYAVSPPITPSGRAAVRLTSEGRHGGAGPGAERAMLRRDAVLYIGTAGVAGWLGVKPQTVTKWLRRYQDMPEPDAYIGPGRSIRMWLPEREAEWRAWACSRPGRGAPGRRRRRHPGHNYGDPECRRVRPVADRLIRLVGHLAKRLEITLRTLRRDTRLLRDLGYPVIAWAGKGGGYSFDPDETVPSLDGNSIA